MTSPALHDQTYFPGPDDSLAPIYEFLHAHSQPVPRYFLTGSEADDRVELPVEMYRVLRQVVDAMQQGVAVTVAPQSQTLTTQEAADLLGVSRPTIIRLIDQGKIAADRVGSHRRVNLRALLDYRETRRAAQYAALDAMAVDLDDEEGLDTALARAREARAAVGSRRQRARS
ncbi:MAG: helix-turn-helix domain-containing protein [Dermatophilaceae bacterium]